MENLKPHDIPAQYLLDLYHNSVLLDADAEEVLTGSTAHVLLDTTPPVCGQVSVKKVAGYIVVEDDGERQEILFLEIDPELRGKGFGSSLIEQYVDANRPSWVYPLDPIARAFFNKVKADKLPLLEIED